MKRTIAEAVETNTRLKKKTHVRVDEAHARVSDLQMCMNEISSKLEAFETDMRRGQWKLATRVEEIDERIVNKTNARMDEMQLELASSDRVMHQRLANTNARLTERLDETNARVDERVNATNTKLEEVQSSIVWHNRCLLVLCII